MPINLSPQKLAADVDARLDRFEESLPTVPAKIFHLQRAIAQAWMERSNAFWTTVGGAAKNVFDVARTSGRTVTGQARAAGADVAGTTRSRVSSLTQEAREAAEDVTESARRGARTVRGQASAQGRRVAKATSRSTAAALDDAIDAVEDAPGSGRPYERWTKAELLDRAKELEVEGRYGMSKAQLIRALRAA
jgi:hypothetical protein